ncbi:MAG TPA: glycosyltransferase family 39 protein [Candidatus Dormibacteraeota bacterium]
MIRVSRSAVPGLLTLVVLRLPSLMEPHWYTDEAGYVNVARSLLNGKILYSQTWNNKPPLMLWTIAGEVKLFGSSETGLHVLTMISGLLAVGAIIWAADRLYTPRRAMVAGLIAAVVLGLPIVDAELAIPESLMIAPLTWAGAITLVHILRGDRIPASRRIPRWPVLVGVLMAGAIAYQQTAIAETSAFCFAMLLAPKLLRRDAFIFLGTVTVITVTWLVAAIITAGPSNVAFALAGFYVGYTQKVLPSSGFGALAHFALAGFAALLIAAGAFLARKRVRLDWVLLLWAGATILVTAVAGQPFPHFLAPAVAPLTLLIAGASLPVPSRLRNAGWRPAADVAPQIAGLLIASVMAAVAGLDWLPPLTFAPGSTHSLSQYYGGAVQALISSSDRTQWDDNFDFRVAGDAAVVAWLGANGLSGSTAVVWSSDAWVYALANLQIVLPTPPIYNDEVLLGFSGPVEEAVASVRPVVIVTSADSLQQYPEIAKLLDGVQYIDEFQSYPDAVWVRSDIAAQIR